MEAFTGIIINELSLQFSQSRLWSSYALRSTFATHTSTAIAETRSTFLLLNIWNVSRENYCSNILKKLRSRALIKSQAQKIWLYERRITKLYITMHNNAVRGNRESPPTAVQPNNSSSYSSQAFITPFKCKNTTKNAVLKNRDSLQQQRTTGILAQKTSRPRFDSTKNFYIGSRKVPTTTRMRFLLPLQIQNMPPCARVISKIKPTIQFSKSA